MEEREEKCGRGKVEERDRDSGERGNDEGREGGQDGWRRKNRKKEWRKDEKKRRLKGREEFNPFKSSITTLSGLSNPRNYK